MSKRMGIWQLALGCVLCVAVWITLFLPMFRFSGDDFVDIFVDTTVDYLKESGKKIAEKTGIDEAEFAKKLDEIKAEEIGDFKKEIKDVLGDDVKSITALEVITESSEDFRKDVLEDVLKLETETAETLMEEIKMPYTMIRFLLAAIYVIPIFLLAVYIFSYKKKLKNMSAVILTWIYTGIIAIYECLWWWLLPEKILPALDSAISTALAEKISSTVVEIIEEIVDVSPVAGIPLLGAVLQSSVRHSVENVVNGFVGDLAMAMIASTLSGIVGMVIWGLAGIAVAYLIYSVLLLIVPGREIFPVSDGQWDWEENIRPYDAPISDSLVTMQSLKDAVAVSKPTVEKGSIEIVRGSLMGAGLEIQKGEQIVVGRDGQSAHLVLDNPRVSRKHCTIQYLGIGMGYQITCYSGNGMGLSDGRQLQALQTASVAKGTQLMFAGGEEVMLLK